MSALAATKASVTMAMTIVASIQLQMAVKARRRMIEVTGSASYQCIGSHAEESPRTTVKNCTRKGIEDGMLAVELADAPVLSLEYSV